MNDNASGPLSELAPLTGLVGSTRINGIPAIFAPRDGLVAAGIMFRVGMADEPFALSGITHLIEHLALFNHSNGDVHHNGETSDAFTHFYVAGSPEEVVAYLNRVCRSLVDLPMDRVETEKQILRTESGNKSNGPARAHRIERFGATGFGIAGLVEQGLDGISHESILEWTRTHFTRHNAVVWMTTAEPLPGLDLTLPDGAWRPLAPARDIVEAKPAFFGGARGGVSLDALVPRSTAGSVFAAVATKALYRSLRQEGGYSYAASCEYDPLDAHSARIALFADALPDQQAAVVGGLVDVLAGLRAGVVDPADLASVKSSMRQMMDQPYLGASMINGTAQRLLLGLEILHPAALVAETEAVTVADIARIGDQVWRDAVAQIPEGSLAWAGFTQTGVSSPAAVEGDRYPYLQYPDSAVIVAGDGVSFTNETAVSTVYFRDCVGVLASPDGGRVFVGSDAFRVVIEPTLLAGITPELMQWLDAQVPPHVIVRQRARAASEIPQPDPAAVAAAARPMKKGLGWWAWVALLPAIVACFLLWLSTSEVMTVFGDPPIDGRVVTVAEVVIRWVLTIAVSVFTVYLLLGLENRRKYRAARRSS